MSFTPWKEAAFLSNSNQAKSSGSSVTSKILPLSLDSDVYKNSDKKSVNENGIVAIAENSKSLPVKKKSTANNVDLEAFDKRFILKTMQKQCSVEFLRKNNLAGAEELILKKKNKANILLAYAEWVRGEGAADSEGMREDNDDDGSDAASQVCADQNSSDNNNNSNNKSNNNRSSSSISSSGKRLIDTFSVLYNRSRSITTSTRTTVLLLHEDYTNELPAFGLQQKDIEIYNNHFNSSNSISNSSKTRQSLENGDLGSGIAGRSGVAGSERHRVICVMGAVRDASDSEVSAAIAGKCSAR